MSGAMHDDQPDTLPDTEIVSGEAPDDPSGEWLTIPEAVARTGRTERSVRRDIVRQIYQVRQVKGRLQLWFPAESGTAPDKPLALPLSGTLPDTSLALVTQLNDLAAQHLTTIERLAAENGELRETVGRLKAELAAATVAPDSVRQPWWRRWWTK